MLKKILMILVCVVLVGSVTVPIINEASDNLSEADSEKIKKAWHYDDYKPSEGASAVSGPLEIVEIDGTSYIHATGIGTASITYGESVRSITISKAPLDVILALGQSNNAYANVDPSEAPVPLLGTAYYYGTATAPVTGKNYADLSSASMRPINVDGTAAIGDKAPAFCKEYYLNSGHKVYYVNGSWDGSSIVDWQPGEIRFTAASTVLAKAIEEIDTDYYSVTYTGYTWIQGEADNYIMTSAQYEEYFITMNEAILSGEMGEKFTYCAMCKIAPRFSTICTAQLKIGEDLKTVTVITPVDSFTIDNGLMGSDNLHYTQAGDNIVGKQLAEVLSDVYYPSSYTNIVKLFDVFPVLLIVSIVLAAAGMIFVRSRD